MKLLLSVLMTLSMASASFADAGATRFRIEGGRIILAQSYCGICSDNATACRLACNGSGSCIQACDDALRDCRLQNCGRR